MEMSIYLVEPPKGIDKVICLSECWSKTGVGPLTFWRPPWPALCMSSPSSDTDTQSYMGRFQPLLKLCLLSDDLSSPAASRSLSLQPVWLYQWHNPSNPENTYAHTHSQSYSPKINIVSPNISKAHIGDARGVDHVELWAVIFVVRSQDETAQTTTIWADITSVRNKPCIAYTLSVYL